MNFSVIFILFLLKSVSSTPIPKSLSKIACESFGKPLKVEVQENFELGENYAQPGEFPFVVGLHYNDSKHWCSGVLISEKFVVTSANCVKIRGDLNVNFVRVGGPSLDTDDSRVSSKAIDIEVEKVIIHPDFNSSTKQNNIGLVKLARPVTFTPYIFPACLNEANTTNIQNFTNAGYGRAFINNRVLPFSKWMLKVQIKNVPWESCDKKFSTTITEKQICGIDDVNYHELCEGSSGGPLGVFNDDGKFSLHATMSFGFNCGSEKPMVFTRTSSYVPWIESYVFGDIQ